MNNTTEHYDSAQGGDAQSRNLAKIYENAVAPDPRPNLETFAVAASTQPEYPFSTLFVATCTGEGSQRFAVAVRMYGVRIGGMAEERWCMIRTHVEAFLLGAMQVNAIDFKLSDTFQRPHELADTALMARIKWLLDAPMDKVRVV